MPTYYESWTLTCNEVGLNFPLPRFYAYAGMSVVQIFDILIKEQLPPSTTITALYCEERKKYHHEQIMKEEEVNSSIGHDDEQQSKPKKRNPPIEVVFQIVKKYHNQIPIGIASSGWKDHIVKGLEKYDLLQYFDTIVTVEDEDVKNGKPHPDMYVVAAQRLGVHVQNCIGFEDADLGMEAIEKAGYLYACDVRLFHNYPRNIERRMLMEEGNAKVNCGEEKETEIEAPSVATLGKNETIDGGHIKAENEDDAISRNEEEEEAKDGSDDEESMGGDIIWRKDDGDDDDDNGMNSSEEQRRGGGGGRFPADRKQNNEEDDDQGNHNENKKQGELEGGALAVQVDQDIFGDVFGDTSDVKIEAERIKSGDEVSRVHNAKDEESTVPASNVQNFEDPFGSSTGSLGLIGVAFLGDVQENGEGNTMNEEVARPESDSKVDQDIFGDIGDVFVNTPAVRSETLKHIIGVAISGDTKVNDKTNEDEEATRPEPNDEIDQDDLGKVDHIEDANERIAETRKDSIEHEEVESSGGIVESDRGVFGGSVEANSEALEKTREDESTGDMKVNDTADAAHDNEIKPPTGFSAEENHLALEKEGAHLEHTESSLQLPNHEIKHEIGPDKHAPIEPEGTPLFLKGELDERTEGHEIEFISTEERGAASPFPVEDLDNKSDTRVEEIMDQIKALREKNKGRISEALALRMGEVKFRQEFEDDDGAFDEDDDDMGATLGFLGPIKEVDSMLYRNQSDDSSVKDNNPANKQIIVPLPPKHDHKKAESEVTERAAISMKSNEKLDGSTFADVSLNEVTVAKSEGISMKEPRAEPQNLVTEGDVQVPYVEHYPREELFKKLGESHSESYEFTPYQSVSTITTSVYEEDAVDEAKEDGVSSHDKEMSIDLTASEKKTVEGGGGLDKNIIYSSPTANLTPSSSSSSSSSCDFKDGDELGNAVSNDDDNFATARELAQKAMEQDKEDFFTEEVPLSEKQLLQSILLAEDAAINGKNSFTTKDKIHVLEKVHVGSIDEDDFNYGDHKYNKQRNVVQQRHMFGIGRLFGRVFGGIKQSRPAQSVSDQSDDTGAITSVESTFI